MAEHYSTYNIGEEFSLQQYLYDQKEWSANTFGPGPRSEGVVKHIEKELAEIRRKPADLFEWVDVMILAFDGAIRAGYEPETIITALVAKAAINKERKWPEPTSQNEPVEHVRH